MHVVVPKSEFSIAVVRRRDEFCLPTFPRRLATTTNRQIEPIFWITLHAYDDGVTNALDKKLRTAMKSIRCLVTTSIEVFEIQSKHGGDVRHV